MKRLSPTVILRAKAEELGLDPERYSVDSAVGIACALRRAAACLAPCSPSTLVRAVLDPLEDLVPNFHEKRETVEQILDTVIAHGDIAEHDDISGGVQQGRLLYAAPPAFVMRKSGTALILGIAPDRRSPLPIELEQNLEYLGHIRRLPGSDEVQLRKTLEEFGLVELSADYWTRAPAALPADRYIGHVNDLLACSPVFDADVPGLTVLDFEEPVHYYRGRWKEPKKQSGRYMGRRKQAYGADLWCYVELEQGSVRRLIDLPVAATTHRACDHAWHLQMAIDAVRGHPQEYTVDVADSGRPLLKFFSPLPQWAQRRLAGIGTPEPAKGSLFSYSVEPNEVEEEQMLLSSGLWMRQRPSR